MKGNLYVLLEKSDARADNNVLNYDAMGIVPTETEAMAWVAYNRDYRTYKPVDTRTVILWD